MLSKKGIGMFAGRALSSLVRIRYQSAENGAGCPHNHLKNITENPVIHPVGVMSLDAGKPLWPMSDTAVEFGPDRHRGDGTAFYQQHFSLSGSRALVSIASCGHVVCVGFGERKHQRMGVRIVSCGGDISIGRPASLRCRCFGGEESAAFPIQGWIGA